jgi:hypothetical protein
MVINFVFAGNQLQRLFHLCDRAEGIARALHEQRRSLRSVKKCWVRSCSGLRGGCRG